MKQVISCFIPYVNEESCWSALLRHMKLRMDANI